MHPLTLPQPAGSSFSRMGADMGPEFWELQQPQDGLLTLSSPSPPALCLDAGSILSGFMGEGLL